MCLFFDLLIPKIAFINKIGFNEELIQWGDEYFSQEPRKYLWKDTYKFTQYMANEVFLIRKLGDIVNLDDFYLYTLDNSNCYFSQYNVKHDEKNKFHDFLSYLMSLNMEIYIILHHDEDETVIYENMNENQSIIDILDKNINSKNTLIMAKMF